MHFIIIGKAKLKEFQTIKNYRTFRSGDFRPDSKGRQEARAVKSPPFPFRGGAW